MKFLRCDTAAHRCLISFSGGMHELLDGSFPIDTSTGRRKKNFLLDNSRSYVNSLYLSFISLQALAYETRREIQGFRDSSGILLHFQKFCLTMNHTSL